MHEAAPRTTQQAASRRASLELELELEPAGGSAFIIYSAFVIYDSWPLTAYPPLATCHRRASETGDRSEDANAKSKSELGELGQAQGLSQPPTTATAHQLAERGSAVPSLPVLFALA
jgi:hypothetical protein